MSPSNHKLANRFRGYLPVVVDIETGGFDYKNNPLLEIAAVIVEFDQDENLVITEKYSSHVIPFKGSVMNEAALAFNGIDPNHPFRFAVAEKEALKEILEPVKVAVKRNDCTRAILVGHNPAFDIGFLNAAIKRTNYKKSSFHLFSTFDTATLGGLIYGQTVLARIAEAAGIEWDNDQAHSALYDAEQTARIFCLMVNKWRDLVQMDEQVVG